MSDLGSEVDTASRSMGGALVKHCDGGSGGAELVELLPQQGFILPFCVLGVWADADYRAEVGGGICHRAKLQKQSPGANHSVTKGRVINSFYYFYF